MIRKDSAAQVLNKELVGSDTVGQNRTIIKLLENREELASSIASSIFCASSGSQKNIKGLINNTGNNTGDANGSIFMCIINNVNIQKFGSEDVQPSIINFKHDLPGSVNENSSQKPAGKAKVTCRGCRREFLVPSNTTTYRCPTCQNFGSSLSISSSLILPKRCIKRAVLCGVTYGKMKFRLKGTINDIMNMKEMLVKDFYFPNECIRVLTEQAKNADLIPTKKNMLESLKWLVEDCRPGDSLVFYFSGHGLKQVDARKDEIDGYDESICPVDFLQEGIILDNDINSTIVWPLKQGVTLHAIVDACHSGTVLDLTNVYDPENCKWIDNKAPAKQPLRKHTSGGLAICLGACIDGQMAADTSAFPGKGMNGVMTHLFTKIIRQDSDITYEGLLKKMNVEIQQVTKNSFRPAFLQHIFRSKIAQDLTLSSSEKFDVSNRIFKL